MSRLHYRIDAASRLVIIQGTESLSDAVLDRIVLEPHFQRGFNFVRDRRELTRAVEPEMVRRVVTSLKSYAPRIAPCRWAVVVPAHDLVFYGMARMASIMMEDSGIQFEAFLSYESAVEWAVKGGAVG
jgi:hypothetical protein